MKTTSLFLITILTALSHSALALTCGGAPLDREASFTNASVCGYGAGNPHASDINGYFDRSPNSWTQVAELTDSGTNGVFTATVDAPDSWGGTNLTGEYSIDASFWAQYSEAVISMHVGNGRGDPDHFAFLMNPNTTSGTWSYDRLEGAGGGLSNIKLWGIQGGTVTVSEPGTIALLAFGILGIIAVRRRV